MYVEINCSFLGNSEGSVNACGGVYTDGLSPSSLLAGILTYNSKVGDCNICTT